MLRKSFILVVVASLLPFSSSFSEKHLESFFFPDNYYYHSIPEDTLLLVHTIFRNGERAPKSEETYPSDPNQSQLYYPYGYGQLVENGKTRMYGLGQSLRNRYKNFLGNYIEPESIKAKTSALPVAEMSLRVLLAALVPWQANIPYEKLPTNADLIFNSLNVCPNTKWYQKQISPENLTKISKRFGPLLSYIKAVTSTPKTVDMEFAKTLYKTLKLQKNFGLHLPGWAKNVYPDALKAAAAFKTKMNTWNVNLKKIAAGYFFKNIINDSIKKINGKTKLKMSLYSGHAQNLAAILDAFGLFEQPYIPSYGSYISFELWKRRDGIYGFKIFQKDDENNKSGYISSTNGDFYTFDVFLAYIKSFIPSDITCGVGTIY